MTVRTFIPVAEPALVGNEREYVLDCIDSSWISSNGKYIERFEEAFAQFCGAKHALSCCNGTVALHIALLGLGIQPGDEVIVPTLTFVATANAVTYCGAKPVFVDCDPATWNITAAGIEAAVTPRTKAVIVVHLYGCPADMGSIMAVARQHNLFVIEDAAEAHGAEFQGRKVGSLGDLGTFSFYGNKIITSGEGGMIVTDDDALAATMRQIKGQGMDPARRYWFPVVGYNYRMTNIEAAIGLAQLERADWHIERRRQVAAQYRRNLAGFRQLLFQAEGDDSTHVYWMTSVVLSDDLDLGRQTLMKLLAKEGIETRPFFYPLHTLPMYRDKTTSQRFPVAERLGSRGINLPSSATLQSDEIDFICGVITRNLESEA